MGTSPTQMSGVCLLDLQRLSEKLHCYIIGINSQVPLSHAANMKGSYENMKLLLEKIQCEKYNWNLYGDFRSHCTLAWLAAKLHKVLLFSV